MVRDAEIVSAFVAVSSSVGVLVTLRVVDGVGGGVIVLEADLSVCDSDSDMVKLLDADNVLEVDAVESVPLVDKEGVLVLLREADAEIDLDVDFVHGVGVAIFDAVGDDVTEGDLLRVTVTINDFESVIADLVMSTVPDSIIDFDSDNPGDLVKRLL